MALAAGYRAAYTFDQIEDLARHAAVVLHAPGPTIVVLKVASEGPRAGIGAQPTSAVFPLLRERLQRPGA